MKSPSQMKDIVFVRKDLKLLLNKEKQMTIKDDSNNYTCSYNEVWMLEDEIEWLVPENFKEGDKQPFSWPYLALKFYFPSQNKIYTVALKECIICFAKPQRVLIMSWIRERLKKDKYDFKEVEIPRHFKNASNLVGAAAGDLTHEEILDNYLNPDKYRDGYIYPEEAYHYVERDPEVLYFVNQISKRIFFPELSD